MNRDIVFCYEDDDCAGALRKNLGAPLTPAEQEKLEKSLQSARQQLSVTAGGSAWLEGWDWRRVGLCVSVILGGAGLYGAAYLPFQARGSAAEGLPRT